MKAGSDFLIKNSKKISLVILICAFAFSFFAMSSNITGMATAGNDTTQIIARSQDSVNFVMQERESCTNDLIVARDSYNSCQSDLIKEGENFAACNLEKTALQKSLSNCTDQKSSLEAELTKITSDFDELAKNSVASKCCLVSDVISGTIKTWSISNNNIQCIGEYKVNCTSGETVK
jgi:hypothetical protein